MLSMISHSFNHNFRDIERHALIQPEKSTSPEKKSNMDTERCLTTVQARTSNQFVELRVYDPYSHAYSSNFIQKFVRNSELKYIL